MKNTLTIFCLTILLASCSKREQTSQPKPEPYFPKIGDHLEYVISRAGPGYFGSDGPDGGQIWGYEYYPDTGELTSFMPGYRDDEPNVERNTVMLFFVDNKILSIMILDGPVPGKLLDGQGGNNFAGIKKAIDEERAHRENPKPIQYDYDNTFTITVNAGDSLEEIAIQYLMTAEALAKINNLSPNVVLKVGQKLKIPKLK